MDRLARPRIVRWGLSLVVAGVLASLGAGCKHNEGDSVVVTGEGIRLSSEAIDRDPLSLLPASPVVLFWANGPAFFSSAFGTELSRILAARVPAAQEAGFVPQRDLKSVVGGVYSLSGADVVAVLSGDFHPDLIKSAAERQAAAPTAMPIVHSTYAGNDLYTTNNVGFTAVTQHTLLVGSETGIRRALDRIRDNRVRRETPEWMTRLLDNPQASAVVAGDLAGQPAVASLASQAPFLSGLQSFRMLGNFQPPGLNVAGSLTYPDATTATNAATAIRELTQRAALLNLLAMFGLGSPLQSMQVEARETDAQFVMALDAKAVTQLLSML